VEDWQAFDDVEPIGEMRADMRQAALACWLASAFSGGRGEPPSLVWPYFPQEQDVAELAAHRAQHRDEYGYEG
jgi:hypothetical protein